MIEPFEYEKTRHEVSIRENKIENDKLDTSLHDRALGKLNHFDSVPENERFLAGQAPFTKAYQEDVGRVKERNNNKSEYQDEVWGTKGSLNSGYDVTMGQKKKESASVLIHRYLDGEVQYVPEMKDTVKPVTNIKVTDPVLQPGISFVDSRKNMAVHF
jgi:hypothetical protein